MSKIVASTRDEWHRLQRIAKELKLEGDNLLFISCTLWQSIDKRQISRKFSGSREYLSFISIQRAMLDSVSIRLARLWDRNNSKRERISIVVARDILKIPEVRKLIIEEHIQSDSPENDQRLDVTNNQNRLSCRIDLFVDLVGDFKDKRHSHEIGSQDLYNFRVNELAHILEDKVRDGQQHNLIVDSLRGIVIGTCLIIEKLYYIVYGEDLAYNQHAVICENSAKSFWGSLPNFSSR